MTDIEILASLGFDQTFDDNGKLHLLTHPNGLCIHPTSSGDMWDWSRGDRESSIECRSPVDAFMDAVENAMNAVDNLEMILACDSGFGERGGVG